MAMRLFLLERIETAYDEYDGAVIRAESENRAREIAEANLADWAIHGSCRFHWTDIEASSSTEITTEGDEGIVYSSMHHA
jgi:hypothetical protein